MRERGGGGCSQLQLLVSAVAFYREKSAACLATYLSQAKQIDLPAASKRACLMSHILMVHVLQTTLCETLYESEMLCTLGKSF
jgi:uncharacterized membrane protein